MERVDAAVIEEVKKQVLCQEVEDAIVAGVREALEPATRAKQLDHEVLKTIEGDVLTPALLEEVLAAARQMFDASAQADRQEELRRDLATVEGQVARMTEAIASGAGQIPALVERTDHRREAPRVGHRAGAGAAHASIALVARGRTPDAARARRLPSASPGRRGDRTGGVPRTPDRPDPVHAVYRTRLSGDPIHGADRIRGDFWGRGGNESGVPTGIRCSVEC
jgi:hypothetical protein